MDHDHGERRRCLVCVTDTEWARMPESSITEIAGQLDWDPPDSITFDIPKEV